MTLKTIFNHDALLRYLLYAALLLVVLIGMKEASYLFNMIFISLILTMIGAPIYYHFKNRGFSDITSVASVMAMYAVAILGFILLIVYSLNVFIANLTKYHELFQYRISEIFAILDNAGLHLTSLGGFTPDWANLSKYAIQFAGNTSALMMDAFFIFVITTFLFLEIPVLPKRLKKLFGGEDAINSNFQEMCNSMIKWLVVKTKTNVVLGAAFGGMLYVLGVDLAIFLGVLAIILSYIPYIGLLIVAVPAVALAWLQLGVWGVIVVVIGICIINAVVENIVFSKFAANDFNMPPLLVILSLVLWTWILGAVGMMLSVPITIMILIALKYNENTAWIPTLLGMDDNTLDDTEVGGDKGAKAKSVPAGAGAGESASEDKLQ